MEVGYAVAVEDDVFKHRSVFPRCGKNSRLVFFRQVDQLGVASSFKVEHTVGAPSMLVVADEGALGVGGQGGLPGARETKEDGGVFPVGVGRAVHGQDAFLG